MNRNKKAITPTVLGAIVSITMLAPRRATHEYLASYMAYGPIRAIYVTYAAIIIGSCIIIGTVAPLRHYKVWQTMVCLRAVALVMAISVACNLRTCTPQTASAWVAMLIICLFLLCAAQSATEETAEEKWWPIE